MTRKAKRWVSSAGRGRRLFIIIGGGVFGVLVIAVTVLSYQSRRASFCDSCHYMDPYVRHWKESSHADVECVKCHDYGLMRLTANAIKYATDTYVPRPKANVLDASCLNSECHDRKSLKGKIEYRNGSTTRCTPAIRCAARSCAVPRAITRSCSIQTRKSAI